MTSAQSTNSVWWFNPANINWAMHPDPHRFLNVIREQESAGHLLLDNKLPGPLDSVDEERSGEGVSECCSSAAGGSGGDADSRPTGSWIKDVA